MNKFTKEYERNMFNAMYQNLKKQTKKSQELLKEVAKLKKTSNKDNNASTEKNINTYFHKIDNDKQHMASLIHLLVLFSTGLNSKPMLKELHRCIEELLIEYNPQELRKYIREPSINYNRNLITNFYYIPIYNIWNYLIKLCKHTQLLEPKYISKRLPNLFKMLQKHESPDSSSGVDTEVTYEFLNHTNRHIANALQQYIYDRKHNVPAEVIAWKTKQLYIYMVSKLNHNNASIDSILYDSVVYLYKHPNQHISRWHPNSIHKIYSISKQYEKAYLKQFDYYKVIHHAEQSCHSERDFLKLDKDLRNKVNLKF